MRNLKLQFVMWCIALACVTGIILGCVGGPQPKPASTETKPGRATPSMVPQVIVTLPAASQERWNLLASELAETYRLKQTGAFPLDSLGVQCIVYKVPEGESPQGMVDTLTADPRVESAQLNQRFQGLMAIYNDRYAKLQYGARAIRADRVHRLATGKGVKVAVVDTGIEVSHPDLRARIDTTANFVKGGEQTFSQEHHGTAVAGVIAAQANNDVGIVGIAPEASVLAVKACREQPPGSRAAVCTTWALAKGIDFAILEGVHILNLSLTGPQDSLLRRLINKAIERGIVVVAAALQKGELGLGFPASLEPVIAVLASDVKGQVRMAAESECTELLAAPGVDILTTTPPGAYDLYSGSSLAAAHVSGLAALLLERDPTLSPAQLHALFHKTATTTQLVDSPSQSTVGMVDACAALEQLLDQRLCR